MERSSVETSIAKWMARGTHLLRSRNSFKEPNFVTESLPLKIFLHNQGENNEADMCQWRLVLKDLPVFM